ncbi:unnamed protein product, partial [marine sediment metagenome]
ALDSPSFVSGTINWVSVYASCYGITYHAAKTAIKTGGVAYDGAEVKLGGSTPGSWGSRYAITTYTVNPRTRNPWILAELFDLQAGLSLKGSGEQYAPSCSLVYVRVNYTPQ